MTHIVDVPNYYKLSNLLPISDKNGVRTLQRMNHQKDKDLVLMNINFFQLLSACHARTLTLFVESFMKTIQKMLESPDPDLQVTFLCNIYDKLF